MKERKEKKSSETLTTASSGVICRWATGSWRTKLPPGFRTFIMQPRYSEEWWEGTSDTDRIVSKEESWEDRASATDTYCGRERFSDDMYIQQLWTQYMTCFRVWILVPISSGEVCWFLELSVVGVKQLKQHFVGINYEGQLEKEDFEGENWEIYCNLIIAKQGAFLLEWRPHPYTASLQELSIYFWSTTSIWGRTWASTNILTAHSVT